MPPVPIRLWDRTTTGQAELRDVLDATIGVTTGPQGPAGPQGPQGIPGTNGTAVVYEQAAEPVGAAVGAIWITSDPPPVSLGTKPLGLIYDDLT